MDGSEKAFFMTERFNAKLGMESAPVWVLYPGIAARGVLVGIKHPSYPRTSERKRQVVGDANLGKLSSLVIWPAPLVAVLVSTG